jgi:DnaJ-class molecular chaperone
VNARQNAAYARAQARYDAMTPPEGPCACDECNGSGQIESASDVDGDLIDCPCCDGAGRLDENGEPFFSYEHEGD